MIKRVLIALVALVLLLAFAAALAFAQDADASGTGEGGEAARTDLGRETTSVSGIPGIEDFLPAYPLSVGDMLTIRLYTPTQRTVRATIDGNGMIVVPPVGRIAVLGLTIEGASVRLEEELSPYYKSVTVTVDVYRLSSVKVFVFGATTRAGVYALRGGTTIVDFLQQLRLSSWGEHRRIHHYRLASFFLGRKGESGAREGNFLLGAKESSAEDPVVLDEDEIVRLVGDESAILEIMESGCAQVTLIDPTDFVALGQLKSKNFLLRDGDIIYFPRPEKTVYVYGSTRPGNYEVLPGEGLLEVLFRAGEVMPERDLAHTVIERTDEDGQLLFQIVELDKYYYSEEEPSMIPLNNGDRIKIFPRESHVTVLGAVNEAGRFGYNPGSGVLNYIAQAGGNMPNANMGGIMVVRGKWRPGGAYEVAASFTVNAYDYAKGKLTDIPPILPGDVIYVPERDALAKRDIASIITSFTISALALFK